MASSALDLSTLDLTGVSKDPVMDLDLTGISREPVRGMDIDLPKEDPFPETDFKDWYREMSEAFGLNPNPEGQFYDYRKAFREGAEPDDSGHWPSQYKLKGHPQEYVGGFSTIDGKRNPAQPRASEQELVRLGWDKETAKELAASPEPTPEQTTSFDPNYKPTALDSLSRGTDMMQSMLYGGVEATAGALGADTIQAWGREGRQANEAEIKTQAQKSSLASIDSPDQFFQWAKETFGEQIPMMAPAMAGGITGGYTGGAAGSLFGPAGAAVGTTVGAVLGAFVPSYLMGVGEVQSGIKEKDPNAENYMAAILGGTAVGILDTALPGKIGSALVRKLGRETAEAVALNLLKKPAAGIIKRTAKGVIVGASSEGLTEGIQEAIGEVAAAKGANKPINWAGLPMQVAEASAAGFLMGGASSGVEAAIPEKKEKAPPVPPVTPGAGPTELGDDPAGAATIRQPVPDIVPDLDLTGVPALSREDALQVALDEAYALIQQIGPDADPNVLAETYEKAVDQALLRLGHRPRLFELAMMDLDEQERIAERDRRHKETLAEIEARTQEAASTPAPAPAPVPEPEPEPQPVAPSVDAAGSEAATDETGEIEEVEASDDTDDDLTAVAEETKTAQQRRRAAILEYEAELESEDLDRPTRTQVRKKLQALTQEYESTYEEFKGAGGDSAAMRAEVEEEVQAEPRTPPQAETGGERIEREERELEDYTRMLQEDDLTKKKRAQYEKAVERLTERKEAVARFREEVAEGSKYKDATDADLDKLTRREHAAIQKAFYAERNLANWQGGDDASPFLDLWKRSKEAQVRASDAREAAIPVIEMDAADLEDRYEKSDRSGPTPRIQGPVAKLLDKAHVQSDEQSSKKTAKALYTAPDGRTYLVTGQRRGAYNLVHVVPEADYEGDIYTYRDKIDHWNRNEGSQFGEDAAPDGPVSDRGTFEGMEMFVRGKRYVATGEELRIKAKGESELATRDLDDEVDEVEVEEEQQPVKEKPVSEMTDEELAARTKARAEAKRKAKEEAPAETPKEPTWEEREASIAKAVKASKASGAKHLDAMPMGVEALRGQRFRSLRDGKDWIATTVDNRGTVYFVSSEGEMISDEIGGKEREEWVLQPQQEGDYKRAVAATKAERDRMDGKGTGIKTSIAADIERSELIDRIVKAARRPLDRVVESIETKGSDGKWYTNGWPHGVTLTDERRSQGFIYQASDGVFYGDKRYDTREAAEQAQSAKRDKVDAEFRAELEKMTPERLQSQAEYWLKGDAPKAKDAATTTAPASGVTFSKTGPLLEVKFKDKPSREILDAIGKNGMGFYWHGKSKTWRAKYTADREFGIQKLLGVKLGGGTVAPAPEEKPVAKAKERGDFKAASVAMKRLENKYGIKRTRNWAKLNAAVTQEEIDAALADAEADFKKDKAESDAKEAAEKEERRKWDEQNIERGRELQLSGDLVWRRMGTDRWEAIKGEAVSVPGAPSGYTFSAYKDYPGPKSLKWVVIEDSTGQALSKGEGTKAKAIAEAAAIVAKNKDKWDDAIARGLKGIAPKPDLSVKAAPKKAEHQFKVGDRVKSYEGVGTIAEIRPDPIGRTSVRLHLENDPRGRGLGNYTSIDSIEPAPAEAPKSEKKAAGVNIDDLVRDLKNLEDDPMAPQKMAVADEDDHIKVTVGDEEVATRILASSLYGKNAAYVAPKELIQNAFDAIRGVLNGEVSVVFGSRDLDDGTPAKHVTVQDNGRGMTRTELKTVFTTIFESGKRGNAADSGGFGIAKASFLLGGIRVAMTTVAEEDGRKFHHSFDATPDELVSAKGAKVKSYEVPADTPTGTVIRTYFKEDANFYDAVNFAKEVSRYSNLPGRFVIHEPGSKPDAVTPADSERTPQFWNSITDTIPGAVVTIDTTKSITSDRKGYVDVHILNNGLYQLRTSMPVTDPNDWQDNTKTHVPQTVVVNIKSTVAEGDPNYAFMANREALRDDFYSDLRKAIYRSVLSGLADESTAMLQKSYDAIDEITLPGVGTVPVFDVGKRMVRAELEGMFANPDVARMAAEVINTTNAILDKYLTAEERPFVKRVGLLLDHKTHGVFIPNPRTVKNRYTREITILINPFQHALDDPTPEAAAAGVWHTGVHEAVHYHRGGHDAPFTSQMANAARKLGARMEVQALLRLMEAYEDPGNPELLAPGIADALSFYEETRRRAVVEEDALSRTGDHSERSEDSSRPKGRVSEGAGVDRAGATGPVDDDKLVVMVKIVRRFIAAGVTDFATVAKGFQQAFGAGARDYDIYLETVWEDLRDETVSVEQALAETAPAPAPEPMPEPDEAPDTDTHTFAGSVYRKIIAKGWGLIRQASNGDSVQLRKEVSALINMPMTFINDRINQFEDAIEAVLNQTLQDTFRAANPQSLNDAITTAVTVEQQMPRAHRSFEKMKLQQFSTPLPISVAAAHAADVRDGDTVLEPTAGTGNLLAPLRRGGIVAVELDPSRADLLREQGINVVTADYLKYPFAGDQKPTVIISNPPWGKYTTGKYGKPVGLEFQPVDVAERFVAKMYRDLAPGGRIVAVMPTTMLDSVGFKNWLRHQTTVRAIVKSPPSAYRTRGTDVESVLLVLDKIKPAEKMPFPAVVAPLTWEAYAQAVEEVPRRESVQRPTSGATGTAPVSRPDGVRQRPGSKLAEPGRDPSVERGRDADLVADERRPDDVGPTVVEQPSAEAGVSSEESEGEFANVLDHSADERRQAADSRHFAPYVRRTTLRGVGHPKLIVEARTLAGVPYPPLTLPAGKAIRTALAKGRVSVEQAEQALAALQANLVNQHGYLAADNVGVGKSREIALVILEMMERAKADKRDLRLIVTTKSKDNIADLIDSELYYVATGRTRDGRDLMNPDAEKVIPEPLDFDIVRTTEWPDAKREGQEYKPFPKHKRAIYITDFYNLSPFRQALADIEPHGLIGDEAHRFKNIEGAAAGGAWQTLHAQIMRGVDKAEQFFAYFTATPAQSVDDYQYLYGLRLWPIDGFTQWAQVVTGNGDEDDLKALQEATERGAFNIDEVAGGDGAGIIGGDSEDTGKGERGGKGWGMSSYADVFTSRLTPAEAEQIPREWKMQGRFSARDLWRHGQEFIIHSATLPPQHEAKYDQFAQLAQDIAKAQYKFGLLDKTGKSSRFGVTGMLQFAAKRIQMQPALEEAIEVAKKYVDQGYQVVLSMIAVNEMDPEKGNIAAAIEKINTRIKDNDPDDPEGGVIDLGEIPEALVARAELLEQAKELGLFENPVDMVKEAFGAEKVSFIIGDSGPQRRIAMNDFQSGKRPVAYLSAAGATGINLDHRVLTEKGPGFGRRVFIDVQFEWSATEAIQRYGRVGRSASVTQPILMPLTFGNASEKKFLATIANRMASLGALSKGGAETTGATGLEEFEITGPDAAAAARNAYNDLSLEDKRKFAVVKSVFRSPNRDPHTDPFEPAATAPSGSNMRDFQLALLFMPMKTSNAFWQSFVTHRESFRDLMGHQIESRTAAYTGEVLRVTDLGTKELPLTLTEVKNQNGSRFGILSGVITPRMPKIREFLYTPDDDGKGQTFTRRYLNFTGTRGETPIIVSGLQIPWGKVKSLAEAFDKDLATEKLDTPEKVLAALKSGEKVELKQKTDGKPWVLSWRRDEKILITGVKMADKTLALGNGAAYSPVGNYWFVADNEKQFLRFLERFPVADRPAPAPKQPKAEKSEGQGGGGRGGANASVTASSAVTGPTMGAPNVAPAPGTLPWGSMPAPATAINPIELPELIQLAISLAGNVPTIVKRFRGRQAAEMRNDGSNAWIRLRADLFKVGFERELAAVLAHEIGHLIDWLPSKSLTRGNLIGRLYSMRKYLKEEFTAADGSTIKNTVIRDELKAFSMLWNPWNRATATKRFAAYRDSSVELYADAVSALLTNPNYIEQKAPTFYKQFFQGLDQKPDVKRDYFELQARLSGTPEELIRRQRENFRAGMEKGERKAIALQEDKEKQRQNERHSVIMHLRTMFVDRNSYIIDLVNDLAKKGIKLAEDYNPLYFLEESNYIGSLQNAWLKRSIQPLYDKAREAGVSWTDVGEMLTHERVMHGDRSEVANPTGYQPERTAKAMKQLEDDLGPDKAKVAHDIATELREVLHTLVEEAHTAGLFTDTSVEMMRKNKFYAPFQVVEHMEADVTWRVIKQVGTFKDINNPANALIMKSLSMMRATERNKMTVSVVDLLKTYYPGEREPAETKWNGKYDEPQEPKDETKALIKYYRKGKLVGEYVDSYIGASVNKESIGHNRAIMRTWNLLTGAPFFRAVFTGYNPGFHLWNFQRDFFRFWKNVPGMTLMTAAKLYAKNLPAAYVRAGKPGLKGVNKVLSLLTGWTIDVDASGKEADRVSEAELNRVLGITYSDMEREGRDSQVEDLFARRGIAGKPTELDPDDFHKWLKPGVPIANAVKPLVDLLKAIGDITETLPKMAAVEYFSKTGTADSLTPMQRSFIRRMVGSPDFLAGGTMTPITNKLFLYSNATLQGQRSDYAIMKDSASRLRGKDPGMSVQETSQGTMTSGVVWKTIALNFVPKLLQAALMWGLADWLFDDDDEDWAPNPRRILERVSEYDKTNYLVVPLGMDDHGNAVIARVPQDFSGQFVGALFWKFLTGASGDADVVQTAADVLDFSIGQLPSMTPLYEAVGATAQMATRKNPYDWYRGRTVLTQQEQNARRGGGEADAWIKYGGWLFQKTGGGIVWKFYPGERPRELSPAQVFLELPVLSNIIGRTFKVTSYGLTEQLQNEQYKVQGEEAGSNKRENDAVSDVISDLRKLEPGEERQTQVFERASTLARELYPEARGAEIARQRSDIRRKIQMGLARTAGDPVLDRVMSATSNAQKAAIIRKARESMSDEQFNDWMQQAQDLRVMTNPLRRMVEEEPETDTEDTDEEETVGAE